MTTIFKFKLVLGALLAFMVSGSIGLAHAHNNVVIIPMSGDDLKPLKNVVTVAKENGDFSSPVTAINAIGATLLPAATDTNPYLIVIAPGVYMLSETLIMKEYVDIAGSGKNITMLTGTFSSGALDGNSAVIVGANNSSLHDLTVENINGLFSLSHGIYNNAASPTISDVNIIVSGGNGSQWGIHNSVSSPTISDVAITVSGGGGNQFGVNNFNQSSPTISGVTIIVSGGSDLQYGIRNAQASPTILDTTISVSGGSVNQYGIYNSSSRPTISPTTISNTTITVPGGSGNQYGIYNNSSADYAIIRKSVISAPTESVSANTGSGNAETYISHSILDGGVSGNPICSSVFYANGNALDASCTPSP